MALFRIQHNQFEQTFDANQIDTLEINEWSNTVRLGEEGWNNRYEYESDVITNLIKEANTNTVLEIGSGPGVLSQMILKKTGRPIEYHLVDKPFAKKYFDDNKFSGKFFVKDISIDLNTYDLLPKYDLIICNDTLEHLIAPSNILKKINNLLNKTSKFFISVPNWRMAHQFLYRGLWDYDNFLYFMYIHGFEVESVFPSILTTPDYPRLSSEENMPEELRRSWNWYFVANLR